MPKSIRSGFGCYGISRTLAVAGLILFSSPSQSVSHEASGDNGSARTIYVDASTGSDSNSGSSSQPMKTLAAAAKIALQNYNNGVSTNVVVEPGQYRESVALNGSGSGTNASLSITAAKPGTVTISGADVWTGWAADSSSAGAYTHAWNLRWGPCNVPKEFPAIKPIVARREIVFVNGSMLKQVLTAGELTGGTFFVDDSAGLIHVYPPTGTDMSSAKVEVGVRPHLLTVHGISNFSLKGLTFSEAASCVPGGAMELWDGSNDTIENSQFNWNNWEGLVLHNLMSLTVRGVQASNNGGSGISGYRLKNMNLQDTETSFNNWRGDWGGFYFFSQAGTKFLRLHNSEMKNFRAVNNLTSGLWFDTDNANVRVENAVLSSNQANGLFLEANQGPITIENSRVCQNRAEGILVLDSDSVTVRKSLLFANKGTQILADGRQKSRSERDWESQAGYTAQAKNLTLQGNTIVGTIPDQLLFKTYQVDAGSASALFSSLSSGSNTWYNSATPRVFQYDPELSGGKRVHNIDFAGWQSFTGLDKDSRFARPEQDPAEACSKP